MPDKKRSEKQMRDRIVSDQSFKIWNDDGTLYAEMLNGKWIKKPKDLEEKTKQINLSWSRD